MITRTPQLLLPLLLLSGQAAFASFPTFILESGATFSCEVEQMGVDTDGKLSIVTNAPNSCLPLLYLEDNSTHNLVFSNSEAFSAACDYQSMAMDENLNLHIQVVQGCIAGFDEDMDGIATTNDPDPLLKAEGSPCGLVDDAAFAGVQNAQIASFDYSGTAAVFTCSVNGYIATGRDINIGAPEPADVEWISGSSVRIGVGLRVLEGSTLSVRIQAP